MGLKSRSKKTDLATNDLPFKKEDSTPSAKPNQKSRKEANKRADMSTDIANSSDDDDDDDNDDDIEHGHDRNSGDQSDPSEMKDFMAALAAVAGSRGDTSRSSLFGAMFGGPSKSRTIVPSSTTTSTGKYSEILNQLRNSKDKTMQSFALQELSEILSVATEDMFVGYGPSRLSGFNTREYVECLLGLLTLQSSERDLNDAQFFMEDYFFDNPGDGAMDSEIMLLACRCLSNLLEANPSANSVFVQCSGVKIMVEKLRRIEYIELAEQVLAVLEKICIDHPFAVVKENGLLACLQYLDFFGLHAQRQAIGIVAKSCNGLGSFVADSERTRDTFSKIQEIIPILESVLTSNGDSRLIDNCVSTIDSIVTWTHSDPVSLEAVAGPSLLTAIVSVLKPAAVSVGNRYGVSVNGSNSAGGTPLMSLPTTAGAPGTVNSAMFTRLIRILVTVCKGSSLRTNELISTNNGVVDAICGFLTGVDDKASSSSSENEIGQTRSTSFRPNGEGVSATVTNHLISRGAPDQIVQVLALASQLFPPLSKSGIWCMRLEDDRISQSSSDLKLNKKSKKTSKSDRYSASSRILRSSTSSKDLGPSNPIPVRRATSPTQPWASKISEVTNSAVVGDAALADYAERILPIMIEVFSTTIHPQIRRLSLESIAKAVNCSSDADRLYVALIGSGGSGYTGFGRLMYELLGMRKSAELSRSGGNCESLLYVSVAVILTKVVVQKCGSRVIGWFIREGILSEVRKCVEDLESNDELLKTALPVGTKSDLQGERENEAASTSGSEIVSEAASSSFLDGVKMAIDRMTGVSASVPSSDTGPSKELVSAQVEDVFGLNGEKFTANEVRQWLMSAATAFLQEVGESKSLLHISSSANSSFDILGDMQKQVLALTGKGQFFPLEKSGDPSAAGCTDILRLESLYRVARYFAGVSSDGYSGVTGFEVLESGVVDGLLAYLTQPGIGETIEKSTVSGLPPFQPPLLSRLEAFLHVFLDGPHPCKSDKSLYVPNAFKILVFRLQECLSRAEDFKMRVAVPPAVASESSILTSAISAMIGLGSGTNLRDTANPALQLSRQVRIRLEAVDEKDCSPSYRNFVVSIHAVATFKSFEEYLRNKVGGIFENPTAGNEKSDHVESEEEGHEDDDGDSEESDDKSEQEDDVDEEMIELSDLMGSVAANPKLRSSHGTPVDVIPPPSPHKKSSSRSPTRAASPLKSGASNVPNLSGSNPSPSAQDEGVGGIPSTPVNKLASYAGVASKNRTSIRFSIGETILPSSSTIFGAIYRNEVEKGETSGETIMSNIWNKTHLINFTKVACSDKADVLPDEASKKMEPTANDIVNVPFSVQLPDGLSQDPLTSKLLLLLRVLHSLNTEWEEIYHQISMSATSKTISIPGVATAADGAGPSNELQTQLRESSVSVISPLPAFSFVNNKITAKLNRQLNEPLIVASSVLPPWCHSISTEFSFFLPFESRVVYLESAAFGYARSVSRWKKTSGSDQSSNNSSSRLRENSAEAIAAMIARVPRQKVRISRVRIVDSMIKIMDLYSKNPALIEVEFFDEVGTGLGPTLEFYSSVCKEIRRTEGILLPGSSSMSLGPAATPVTIWRNGNASGDYLNPVEGLFPSPMDPNTTNSEENRRKLYLLESIGTFVAKALLDSRVVDLPFSSLFLDMVVNDRQISFKSGVTSALHLLKLIDVNLHNSLLEIYKFSQAKSSISSNQSLSEEEKSDALRSVTVKNSRIEDLSLDFTLPGYPTIELISNGTNIPITLENVQEYIERIVDLTIGSGIAAQLSAFKGGFNKVFDIKYLRCFSMHELGLLLAGSSEEDWSYLTILDSIKADHGFTRDSKTVQLLVEMMSSFNFNERREFLLFVTGSPRLPIGGFNGLSPRLTVVRKSAEFPSANADSYLPSVMTCVNYLKVPEYSDEQVMRARFDVAMKEGQGSFHLS
ncbi:Ubiquitin fusion degradation protein 4 [Entophlyctis luteolus]|nr:Ubiquitin fusion degradation protein 4 [Entophlyctis luteolus]